MRNLLLSIVLCLSITVLMASCAKRSAQSHRVTSAAISYAPTKSYTPTKYAVRLYAVETFRKKGNVNRLAHHVVLQGTGQFNWQKNISERGEYEVVLNYSVRSEGASVKVRSGMDAISSTIYNIEDIYSESKGWHQPRLEPKLLVGRLNLTKGLNSITLKVNAPTEDFKTAIYALELIPVAKKPAIKEELVKAREARPSMDWFSSMKYGVMFHWTFRSAPRSGPPKTYKEAVKDFDVDAFRDMIEKTGAEYIIFTGSHADPHFPAPLKVWEKVHPGWTTNRDLISEISEALSEKNIRFFLYLSTHVYTKQDKVDTKEFESLNFELISEIGERYKDKIDGYWFDGFNKSYRYHPSFGFEKFYKICKAGNPDRLLALNSWLYPIVTPWQDYWAGEIYTPGPPPLGIPPNDRIIKSGPGKGLQYHSLVTLERGWVHTKPNTKISPPRLDTDELIEFISSGVGKGPVTININIYQDGTISKESLAVMEKLKQEFRKSN